MRRAITIASVVFIFSLSFVPSLNGQSKAGPNPYDFYIPRPKLMTLPMRILLPGTPQDGPQQNLFNFMNARNKWPRPPVAGREPIPSIPSIPPAFTPGRIPPLIFHPDQRKTYQ